ncbi:hypothetical protein DFH07DRAFT_808521 [Mycena maculata]|uniref:Uncharacterized protein n=1 Tax=Mycena maculata TaxID=230809 RepID=A0AAD7JLL2_9AGAR|nr:hypothetical protein DFH07DRAFT_808521 [Mycena maculata]
MLASLTGQRLPSDSDGESDEEDTEMPSLERIIVSNNNRAADWPLPMMFDSDSDEMPALASVSNSSDSDPSSDSADSDSSSEDSDEAATDEQAPPIRPFDLEFDPGMQARHEDGGVFERFSNLWAAPAPAVREAEAALIESTTRGVEAASDSTTPVEEEDADDADDDEDMPPLEREPPFVTDGRGRVVWSSPSGSGYVTPSSSARRASASGIPGAFSSGTRAVPPEKPPSPRQPPGEGGFTTDGRGRVIGTTGTREDEEAEREETDDEEPEAPTPARSFLGRVLGAFF